MSEERGYWGIEIGQAGLKALRIQSVEGAGKAVATNFDYVPHAKILSQPDAVPDELIATALDTFLGRNDVRGDAIAFSVPAQQTLARFIQLPPVEQKKVAQIVQYEAKQQIPFALEDAIWDFQTLGGGAEESGYLLEAEVGIFAIKREQLMQHLRPLLDRKVEVELIQGSSLALFNFLAYDRLKIRPDEPFTPGDDYTVLCEMGTDNTILIVTNGAKIWIRVVPIGGNHFTRSLVKDMKLTFAKAEHLKNNATKSPDPKAVFQAMRPVFNDYVGEIQKSIGYFSSVNRSAKIAKVLGVGNGFKLAGLQKFLQQNLQYPVERVDRFESLVGEKVLSDAVFQENILGFVVPYGLAVQAMGQTSIRTTLLPPEIATARKIRRKKPWAVLTAAALMGLLAVSALGYGNVWRSVSPARFGSAETLVEGFNGEAANFKSQYGAVETRINETVSNSDRLVGNLGTREYWPELMRAVNEALPRDDAATAAATDITKKQRIRISSFTTKKLPDVSVWFNTLTPQAKGYLSKEDAATPPTGPGYVVTLVGEHFHAGKEGEYAENGIGYVQNTLLTNLQKWVHLQESSSPEPVPIGKIGISHAMIVNDDMEDVWDPRNITEAPEGEVNPLLGRRQRGAAGYPGPGGGGYSPPEAESYAPPEGYSPDAAHGGGGGGFGPRAARNPNIGAIINNPMGQPTEEKLKYPEPIKQTMFTIQFIWKPTPQDTRTDTRPAAGEVAATDGAATDPAMTAPAATPADPAAMPMP